MKNAIPSLNGLRAISIAMVIWLHLVESGSWHTSYDNVITTFFNGHFGVNIFFVISGFLITKLLLAEEKDNGFVSLRHFYIRRVLRIFPAYYFLLFVYFILQLGGVLHISAWSWLTSLTFTKQFNCFQDSTTTNHLWSLSVEEMFYLFWPVAFIYFKKYRVKVAIGVIVSVIVARIFLMKFPVDAMSPLTIFQRADALMVGCLFAIYYDQITERLMAGKANLKLIFAFIALAFSLALPAMVNQLPVHHVSLFFATLFGDVGFTSSFIIACIIIMSINLKNSWYSFLNNRFVNYIGKLSYSIYLWQTFFIAPNSAVVFQLPVYVKLLIIFVVANLSYYLIEKPFLKFKSRFV